MSVQLEDVTIRYGSHVAVSNATAEFPSGAVGLLGRNGAGKSSILKALLGLVQPSSGRLEIEGVSDQSNPLEIRRLVGYMPEKDCHIPELNGYETVALAGEITGLPRRDAARRAHEVLYLVGLDEQRYRPVGGYSTGMKQKVKLGCGLVHDPKILFLDEPTNGLDPAGRVEMLQLIEDLARDMGKSVLLSSHILQDVERVCEHIVLLEKGQVLRSGRVQDLTRHEVRILLLETSAPLEQLAPALQAVGILDCAAAEAPEHYQLTLPEDLPARAVFAAVTGVGGTVRRLSEVRRTLEDVFLGAVDAATQEAR